MGAEETARHPREVLEDAITLLGNAVGQTSKIRRKRVLRVCNPDIQDLADEEVLFAEAAPNLFGQNFETKMKERAESIKLLRRHQRKHSAKCCLFRGGHSFSAQRSSGPSSYRGGRVPFQVSSFRPRGTYRENPKGTNRSTKDRDSYAHKSNACKKYIVAKFRRLQSEGVGTRGVKTITNIARTISHFRGESTSIRGASTAILTSRKDHPLPQELGPVSDIANYLADLYEQADLISGPVSDVANYLADLYEQADLISGIVSDVANFF